MNDFMGCLDTMIDLPKTYQIILKNEQNYTYFTRIGNCYNTIKGYMGINASVNIIEILPDAYVEIVFFIP